MQSCTQKWVLYFFTILIIFNVLVCADPSSIEKKEIAYVNEDTEFSLHTRFRPEMFYLKNVKFLNNKDSSKCSGDIDVDRYFYPRHILDLTADYIYGKASKKCEVVHTRMTIRNRAVWGDHNSIASTTESTINRVGVTTGAHRHDIPRMLFWLREAWLQFYFNDMIDCSPFENRHAFTLGAFPWEVGRGIALGSAYGTVPDLVGYYAEASIDQYAFGLRLSGDLLSSKIFNYDIYWGILNNKEAKTDDTMALIFAQQYDRRNNPYRQFGSLDYVLAAKFKYTPILCNSDNKAFLEPYILFNKQSDQKVEFVGDANGHLTTPGISGEFTFGNFDFGFDTAFNIGHQKIAGWDRNILIEQLDPNGFETVVNNKVVIAGTKTLVPSNATNQPIINNSVQSEQQNGQIIGTGIGLDSKEIQLQNSDTRFRDPYGVKFRGSMFVADCGFFVYKPNLKFNLGLGYASGDENPHKNLDTTVYAESEFKYDGFISLQEIYSGTRIKSAFLLGGQLRAPRILSFPVGEIDNPFPSSVSRFSNIVFVGGSSNILFKVGKHGWNIRPNILGYWQDKASDLLGGRKNSNGGDCISKYLGVEANAFVDVDLLEDFRFFTVIAIFFPGQHYKDIKGIPLSADQKTYLENLSTPGAKIVPTLGDNNAWFINCGLEYKF